MNDKELKYMTVLAETGSIQKAAAILGKNASSLSRMTKRIEDELDITLFRRSPSGLVPTDEGQVYLKAAKEILALYNKLESFENSNTPAV